GDSSDRGLQLGPVKLESLVIAHQPWRGEYGPGPCTHRPSSHGSWGGLKRQVQDAVRAPPVTGAMSEQGSRTGRCGWNISFLGQDILLWLTSHFKNGLVAQVVRALH